MFKGLTLQLVSRQVLVTDATYILTGFECNNCTLLLSLGILPTHVKGSTLVTPSSATNIVVFFIDLNQNHVLSNCNISVIIIVHELLSKLKYVPHMTVLVHIGD